MKYQFKIDMRQALSGLIENTIIFKYDLPNATSKIEKTGLPLKKWTRY